MKDTKNYFLFFLAIVLIIIFLDQLTKFLVESNVIHIAAVHNTGAAFGLFKNSTALFIWFGIAVIGFILYFYNRIPKNPKIQTFVALIFAGTLSNLIDRIRLGYVIDFIDLKFWPAFNVADAAVTIGIIGLIIYLCIRPKEHKK